MDKWTKQFMTSGPSQAFADVMQVLHSPKALEKWARAHTEGSFGAIFGLGQAQEFLHLQSGLAKDLTANEREQYRRICAAAVMSQETRIPPLFLLFRSWGFDHLREYLTWVISKSAQSHWQWIEDAWDSGMNAVNGTRWTHLADLDERAKLVIYRAAYDGGRLPLVDVPPAYRQLEVFTKPGPEECVRYAIEDMKSGDVAALLKRIGCKQTGAKSERIQRVLDAKSTEDIAALLKITPDSYLHLCDNLDERSSFTHATVFMFNLASEVFRFDFKYTLNRYKIEQAKHQGWGIRLAHYAKCPIHGRTTYSHRELDSIEHIAYPDCDADFSPIVS